ncbi:helix-turn-helix transcriptional regulator [Streptomyces sp. NPDC093109]|uniref:helix-turn-helix domain-containing protein n=1 Tax=Streptomyces sp. NPDC093109 TaxID=3154977 RepID=UPI00344BBF15
MVNRKELNAEASPQAAFGVRLRSAREARGWTQDALGVLLGYSGRHISAVETGSKPPTRRLSRGLDTTLGLVGSTESFERAWGELRNGSLLEGFPEYLSYEGRAVEIWLFEIGIIPGLLQTPEYARVLADNAVQRGAITRELADSRATILAERQATLTRPRAPLVLVVIDESCVRRTVGGVQVMDAQLQRLVEFAALPNTVLQVAPYDMGEQRTLDRPTNLLTLADRSVVAYVESQTQGHLDRETASVVPLLTAYHQLQAEALSQAASVAMINEARKGTP